MIELIEEWLSQRQRKIYTYRQYKSTITTFRKFLMEKANVELLENIEIDKICAEIWTSLKESGDFSTLSPSTTKSRMSMLRTFYDFCIYKGFVGINPIREIARDSVKFSSIIQKQNINTPEAKRNKAVLHIAQETCHPFSHLAEIRMCDLSYVDGIYFVYLKGRSNIKLSQRTSDILSEYLTLVREITQDSQAKIWVSFSNRNHLQPISQKTVANICAGKLSKLRQSSSEVVELYKKGYSVLQILNILEKGKHK